MADEGPQSDPATINDEQLLPHPDPETRVEGILAPIAEVEEVTSPEDISDETMEKARELLGNDSVDVAVHTTTSGLLGNNDDYVETTSPGFKTIGTNPKLYDWVMRDTAQTLRSIEKRNPANKGKGEELLRSFAQAGVSELVTIMHSSEGKPIPVKSFIESANSGEPVSVIAYETLSDVDQNRFPRPDNFLRNASKLKMIVVLPESMAREFESGLKNDPRLVRAVLDVAMREKFGEEIAQLWDSEQPGRRVRPDYDEWRSLNDDTTKMALRTNHKQGPQDSTILEY